MDDTVTGTRSGRIVMTDVGKAYKGRSGEVTVAVEHVNLEVAPGEFVAIVGPSGCGKTTLLRMIAGLIPQTSGEVLVDGQRVRKPSRRTGFVFQQPTLLPWRTVLQNVLLPSEIAGITKVEATERAWQLLELVRLTKFAHAYPNELSGGMQQRVGICRGLVNDPDVVLMDEPLAALDALSRERMTIELQNVWMAKPKTVVFVTHSISEAILLADRVLVMRPRPGEIVDVIDVGFERPRDIGLTSSDRVSNMVRRIRSHFNESDSAT